MTTYEASVTFEVTNSRAFHEYFDTRDGYLNERRTRDPEFTAADVVQHLWMIHLRDVPGIRVIGGSTGMVPSASSTYASAVGDMDEEEPF